MSGSFCATTGLQAACSPLSSRVFASYANIIDHCCYAWNRLTDQPWTIMSIGIRDWANA